MPVRMRDAPVPSTVSSTDTDVSRVLRSIDPRRPAPAAPRLFARVRPTVLDAGALPLPRFAVAIAAVFAYGAGRREPARHDERGLRARLPRTSPD